MFAAKKTTSNSALWVGITCRYRPLEDDWEGQEFDRDGDRLEATSVQVANSTTVDVKLFIRAGTDSRRVIRQMKKVERWLRKYPALLTPET